jgi:hypothetical protein
MNNVMPTIYAACPPLATQCAALTADARGGAPPVIGAATSPIRLSRLHPICFVLLLVLLLPGLCALGVASYFHLSSPSQSLRSAIMESVPGQWHRRFALHVGGLTFGLARFGSSFFHLPPEPKAALQALRAGEVGVYRLEEPMSLPDYGAILKTADKSMRHRGWERIVGIAQGSQFVAVYAPGNLRLKDVSCCVAVLNDQNLIVVSARGNITPLLELARTHLHDNGAFLARF